MPSSIHKGEEMGGFSLLPGDLPCPPPTSAPGLREDLLSLPQKADKSALEAMVNHGQLQLATSQLSEMMQELLQKMSLQDKDWQKALEKLFVDMDCKVTPSTHTPGTLGCHRVRRPTHPTLLPHSWTAWPWTP